MQIQFSDQLGFYKLYLLLSCLHILLLANLTVYKLCLVW